MALTPKDIWTVREAMRRRQPFYTNDDAAGVKMWVLQNEDKVLLYQPQIKADDQPFMLVWSTPWQQKKLATLGHHNAVAFDATFGTNHLGFPLYTMVAFDKFLNAIPVAFALLQRYKAPQVIQTLTAVKNAANAKRMELGLQGPWTPNCWIIDVASEEQAALKAWTKNIISKVFDPFAKAAINIDLGSLMYSDAPDLSKASEDFMDRWRDTHPAFVAYYKKEWHYKVSRWAIQFRTYRNANQNTNGGIERWHHAMKVELKADKSSIKGRSLPWLLECLQIVENHYWYISADKFQGRIRNRIVEQLVHKCIVRAKAIPDEHVLTFDCGSIQYATVRSVSDKYTGLKEHLVSDWDKDDCSCTCGYSMKGNACKHQVLLVTKRMTELEVLTQLGAKFGTFCGGIQNLLVMQDGDLQVVPPSLANVTLQHDDEDLWDEPAEDRTTPVACPMVEEFEVVLKDTYERIFHNCTLTTQALKKLKAWSESLFSREAQQNVTMLGSPSTHEPLDCNPDSDITTMRKQGWVDKLMQSKGQRKRKDESRHGTPKKKDHLKEHVTGANAPKKLQIKKKDKTFSAQGKFDKEAIDALSGILEGISDRIPSTTTPQPNTQSIRSGVRGKKPPMPKGPNTDQTAKQTKGRSPRTRSTPPYPLAAVTEACSQSGVMRMPLTPLQSNMISSIRIGSSQPWAMSPDFSTILASFSGAQDNVPTTTGDLQNTSYQ